MVSWKELSVAVIFVILGVCLGQQQECAYYSKCNECIQTPGCKWCSKFKDSAPGEMSHCLTIESSEDDCMAGSMENPMSSDPIPLKDDQLSESARKSKSEGEETIVQLKPQSVRVGLRRGTSKSVSLKYRQAHGYPIDLYYLMDLSSSMKDDKEQLAKLGETLINTLRNLTEDYSIGFGSFVDKVLMPFVNTHPNKINSPCAGCAKAYAFRNDLPLGQHESYYFAERVTEAKISGNLDAPEGGFDALMQVIVCKNEIKWRNQTRRIIVFSTDAQFHQAGDGKLAGVVVPNDMKCHLNSDGEYDAYDKYDYPSIGQIHKMTKQEDIYVIFAVSNHDELYSNLPNVIENSSWGRLSNNSKNVVNLVRDQYKKISSVVSLTDNSSDAVSITYRSSCKEGSTLIETNQCNNMKEGDEVVFELEVKLNKCPEGIDRELVEVKTQLDIFMMEIEFKCDCNCEKEDDATLTSEFCSSKGALVCGVCSCFGNLRGEFCQCDAHGGDVGQQEESHCKASQNATVCSGRGHCVCGICDCNEEDFTGRFCDCNRRKCLSPEGEMCSNKGTCSCETCSCIAGYKGTHCECQTDAACRKSGLHEICSGNGECNCGKCECDSGPDATYSGQFCDDCLTCKHGKCFEFFSGVLCRFNNPVSAECNLTVSVVDSLDDEEERGARLCSFIDEEDDCMIFFTYRYVDSSQPYEIFIKREKQCPEPTDVMGIVFGILAGIVFIGLLTLLLWKLLTTIHDRKEYAKFIKDSENAQWNTEGNPLYKTPTNTYANPSFSKQAN